MLCISSHSFAHTIGGQKNVCCVKKLGTWKNKRKKRSSSIIWRLIGATSVSFPSLRCWVVTLRARTRPSWRHRPSRWRWKSKGNKLQITKSWYGNRREVDEMAHGMQMQLLDIAKGQRRQSISLFARPICLFFSFRNSCSIRLCDFEEMTWPFQPYKSSPLYGKPRLGDDPLRLVDVGALQADHQG